MRICFPRSGDHSLGCDSSSRGGVRHTDAAGGTVSTSPKQLVAMALRISPQQMNSSCVKCSLSRCLDFDCNLQEDSEVMSTLFTRLDIHETPTTMTSLEAGACASVTQSLFVETDSSCSSQVSPIATVSDAQRRKCLRFFQNSCLCLCRSRQQR